MHATATQDMLDGTSTFIVTSMIPAVESYGFCDQLRTETSGAATSPQLLFDHWEILDADPLSTETGSGGLARTYVDAVRSRKGMPLATKIVESAEKQRTLSRKK